jgi:D-sedoheptulose 7-phosphate isomerase
MKEQELSIETDIIFDHMGLINIGFASIDHEEFKKAAELIWLTSISNHRNNIYTIGNGASASIAQHWACDYTKGCKKGGLRPRVISLAANIPLMTAVANDISYDDVYSFQLDALGQEGDVLVAISSSGNSPNVVKAIETAKSLKIKTIALTGFSPDNKCAQLADISLHVDIQEYEAAEDVHQAIMHMIAKYIRNRGKIT